MSALPPLPVALPLAVAALLIGTSPLVVRPVRDLLAITTALSVAAIETVLLLRSLDGPLVYWFGGWGPRDGVALGISFAIDPIGAGLAVFVAVLVTTSLVYSWRYFDAIGALYPALMLVFLGAMSGFCLTGDLFNLFVFFELMSVSAYALTAYKIEEEPALMGAFNFAISNSVGAFSVLAGIGLLYGRTGALNMAQIGQALASHPADGLVIVSLTLITCGLGVKAALVPFQFWLADAHAVAPSPVCVLFSGVMVELALYGIARIYWTVFVGAMGDHAPAVREVWIALGVLTLLAGAVMCFAERHLKRLLAFSTVSHTGAFLLGVALLTPDGLAGSALYVVGHGLVKGSLFLAAGLLLNRFGSVDENELHGRGRLFPGLGMLFLLGGLALSGLPPFGTWLGKTELEEAGQHLQFGWLKPLLLIASAFTGGAVLRATGHIFLGLGPRQNVDSDTPQREEKETKATYDRPPAIMFWPAATLLGLALAVGLWPGLSEQAERAARRFQDRPAYCAAVLEGRAAPTSNSPSPSRAALPGVLWGLGAAAGAVFLAAVALFPESFKFVYGVARLGAPLLAVLRGLHSGVVADYILWVVVGITTMGGCLAWLFHP